VDAEENLPSMGVGGNGWTPGMDTQRSSGTAGAMGAAAAAAKLAGRTGGKPRAKKASTRRSVEDDELDALLTGGKQAGPLAAAEEQFPSSRGLVGRGKGLR